MSVLDGMQLVWLGVTVLAAIVEAAVPSLVSVWFVPGGLAALLVSFLGGAVWLQILVFVGVSAAALGITRPLYRRFQSRKVLPTNADRVLGKEGVVTETIDNLSATGRAEVLGVSWAARSELPGVILPAGTTVVVERIEGVKVIVRRAEADPTARESERSKS